MNPTGEHLKPIVPDELQQHVEIYHAESDLEKVVNTIPKASVGEHTQVGNGSGVRLQEKPNNTMQHRNSSNVVIALMRAFHPDPEFGIRETALKQQEILNFQAHKKAKEVTKHAA